MDIFGVKRQKDGEYLRDHLMFVKMLDRLAELELIGLERPVPNMIKRRKRRR